MVSVVDHGNEAGIGRHLARQCRTAFADVLRNLNGHASNPARNGVSREKRRRGPESYAHIPMPRMTNTFMLAGEATLRKIIRSVPKGLYCATFGGGQSGYHERQLRLSSDGKLFDPRTEADRPVKGASLIGNGPEALKYVSMVGHDLELDEGIASGQGRAKRTVGVGIPHGSIDKMTVGEL